MYTNARMSGLGVCSHDGHNACFTEHLSGESVVLKPEFRHFDFVLTVVASCLVDLRIPLARLDTNRATCCSPIFTWLVTSRHTFDVSTHAFWHFGCVELVEQHGATRRARHVERVVSCRDVT